MKKRRWVLLGLNLLLAAAILARPGEAAAARNSEDCLQICMVEWVTCVLDGNWDCNIGIAKCFEEQCTPFWGPR